MALTDLSFKPTRFKTTRRVLTRRWAKPSCQRECDILYIHLPRLNGAEGLEKINGGQRYTGEVDFTQGHHNLPSYFVSTGQVFRSIRSFSHYLKLSVQIAFTYGRESQSDMFGKRSVPITASISSCARCCLSGFFNIARMNVMVAVTLYNNCQYL